MGQGSESWMDLIHPGGLIPTLLEARLLLYIPMCEEWDGEILWPTVRLCVSGVPAGIPYDMSALRFHAKRLEFDLRPSGELAERWHARQNEEDIRMATITIASGFLERNFRTIFAEQREPRETNGNGRLRLIHGGLTSGQEAGTRVR